MTHFIRFPDAETGMKALEEAGLLDDDQQFITASHNHALDVIGTIFSSGEWALDDSVITSPTVLDGWHVNFQGKLPEGWEEFVVEPQQPVRVFA